jgi:hypothetical protein
VLAVFVAWSLGGPYYAYPGYGNFAAKYGRWTLGGFWAVRYWLDWSAIIWISFTIAWFCWQLGRDFRAERL